MEGAPVADAAALKRARDDTRTGGGTVLPAALALGIAALAAAAHRKFVG
jgi:hypothetical protein